MERALLTPDELRRFDIDKCIIFEKGIRPIKANKYYYFKHNEAKQLERYRADHNEARELERGEWRTFNPYNPYTPEGEKQPVNDLKIDSLDDLFADETTKQEKPVEPKINNGSQFEPIETNTVKNQSKPEIEDIPMLPQEEVVEDKEIDIAKELEAKFDEIFGPIDETDTAKK